jgi:hypothetical protein
MVGPKAAFLTLTVFAAGLVAASAHADGLPVLGVDVGAVGVTTPTDAARYVTLPAAAGTVVARVQKDGGQLLASRPVRGSFTIPAVAYDGSASGLSADGRTLVLIQPRPQFPRTRTALAVLDAKRLRLRAIVHLRGDFSFDAVSPHGGLLYLIQYISPRDPNRYLVRAYDLRADRLLAEPVTDPHERGEQMRGSPLSRASSPDGRWAYTLYDGAGKEPFIHALDTARKTARCIDLDALTGSHYLSQLRLRIDSSGATLAVHNHQETELSVDTRTFAVTEPSAAHANDRDSVAWTWTLVWVIGAGVLIAIGAGVFSHRRRRSRPGQQPVAKSTSARSPA